MICVCLHKGGGKHHGNRERERERIKFLLKVRVAQKERGKGKSGTWKIGGCIKELNPKSKGEWESRWQVHMGIGGQRVKKRNRTKVLEG